MDKSVRYLHSINYFTYKGATIGIIPSMDKAFMLKNQARLPEFIASKEIPIFHESFQRKNRIKSVFVLTNACNLQCSYCFEGTHNNRQEMDPQMVKNCIVKMFSDARKLNKKIISFSLFGGEPSMNWEAVKIAVFTAKELEQETGIKCYKAIVTNGVMSIERAVFLADNMDFVYFSFDGPKELYLLQRKPKGGNEVYDRIFSNAQEIYKRGTYLSFKVTVTKHTIEHLKGIDDYFSYHFPTCGRLYQPCMVPEDDDLYISFGYFLKKYSELKRYSIFKRNMTTSLYKNKPSDRFCNLMIRNVVYPDGNVLSCHRSNMCIQDDIVKKTFLIGNCDSNGTITRDKNKQAYMESFTVNSISSCKLCPMRYHCCGGCATIKLLSGNHDVFRKADYCDDFQNYIWTEIISRLSDTEISFLDQLPMECCSESGFQIEDDFFFERYVDKMITIEE